MKDAFYFSHDSNARNDPKMAALRHQYGWVGYALFFATIECLRDQPNYSYPIGVLYGLALAVGFDANDPQVEGITFEKFIKDCLEIGLLKEADGLIFSDSLNGRMRALDVKRQVLSEAGKIGANKRWGRHSHGNSHPIASKVKESKVNNTLSHQPAIDYFCSKYEEFVGTKYFFQPKDAAIVSAMLKTYPLEQFKNKVNLFFSSKDEWLAKAGYSIGILQTQINKLHNRIDTESDIQKIKERAGLR